MASICCLLLEVIEALFSFLPRSMVSVRMIGVIVLLICLDFCVQQLT
ncbi:MAG: hypothetical protein RL117_2048 [Verrucomicrobiota bacterium]